MVVQTYTLSHFLVSPTSSSNLMGIYYVLWGHFQQTLLWHLYEIQIQYSAMIIWSIFYKILMEDTPEVACEG